jgi:hypothetical protein
VDKPHDSTAYPDLMAERDSDPDVLLGDRGYDSDPIRDDVRASRARPLLLPGRRIRGVLVRAYAELATVTGRCRAEHENDGKRNGTRPQFRSGGKGRDSAARIEMRAEPLG